MPIARFQMPDGRIGRFEVPDGTTPEAAQSQIEVMVGGQQGMGNGEVKAPPAPGADLWSKLETQESSGRQSAISPKGAIGVAQIMPGTAPEAAALAGLPFDENRYKSDADYNRKLGQAYLGKQMQDYGDEKLALAAYNAGPGRVNQTIAKVGDPRNGQVSWDKFMAAMPEETQNYVRKISGPWSVKDATIQDVKEGGRIAASGIKGGLGAIPKMLQQGLSSASQWGSVAADELGIPSIPGLRDLPAPTDLLKSATGYLFTPREGEIPQTKTGQGAARVLGSTIAGAMSPGSVVPNLIAGFGSGLGAEVGQEVGGQPGAIVGGIAGALAPTGAGLVKSLIGTPFKTEEKLATGALKNVTDYQLAIARERMQVAQQQGVNLTLEQAMPGETNLRKLQETLVGMKAGEPLAAQLRTQPEEIANASQAALKTLPGEAKGQQEIANQAQKSATEAYAAIKKTRSDAVRPDYVAAGNFDLGHVNSAAGTLKTLAKDYPNVDAGNLLSDIADRMFTKSTKIINGQEVTISKPITNVNKLNRVLREAKSDLGKPNISGKSYSAETSGIVNDALQAVRNDLGTANPAFANANAKYADLSIPVNAAKQGPLGQVTGRTGYDPSNPASRTTLYGIFDRGTAGGGKSEILTLQRDMAKAGDSGKKAFSDAGTSWFAEGIDKALKSEGGALKPDVARTIEKTFFETPSQARGTRDVLAGIAKSQGVDESTYVNGLQNWIQTVKLAAKRPGTTSGRSSAELKDEAKTGFARVANINIIAPARNIGRAIDEMINHDAYAYISKLMQTPEGIDTLKALAKSRPGSQPAQTAIAKFNSIMAAEQAASEQE